MTEVESLLLRVLDDAISELERSQVPVHTFAFYRDHESGAVSVCADTAERSRQVVSDMNRYNMKHFARAIGAGKLDEAKLWQANIGRSLSLGDFAHVNVARREFGDLEPGADLYLLMAKALVERESKIVKLAKDPAELRIACSTADDEVGLVWCPFGEVA